MNQQSLDFDELIKFKWLRQREVAVAEQWIEFTISDRFLTETTSHTNSTTILK